MKSLRDYSYLTPFLLAFAATPVLALDERPRGVVEMGAAFGDAPTMRLHAAIMESVKTSESLELGTGLKPGTLVISFSNPVEERVHLGRTEYLYRVEFRGVNGRLYERGTGSCWSDEVARCVSQVLRLANRFAPRE
jgi:hypothetical protein